ncbi:hypothetical protein ACOSQ3_022676 [Xanthoceras sorbifolium]
MSEDSTTSNPNTPNQPPVNLPNDHHSVRITNIRLNGDNFLRWSLSVRMYILGRGKGDYLTGKKTAPAKEDSSYATWEAENFMVMSWLVNSMEEDIAANYLGHPTAKAMWNNLSQMYSDLGNQSQIYEIELKIGETKQGTESVTKYFSGLKRLWQDLDMFFDHKWKDAADGVYFQKVLENSRVFKFLAGLNVDFDEVRGRIIGRQPLPSLNEVFAEVRREESRRGVMLGNKNSSSTPVETSALVSQDISAYKGYTRKPNDKPKVWCDHCNKPRHTRDTCCKLHGKPANWKPREKSIPAAYAADNPFFNKDQINQLLKLITPSSEGSSSVPSGSLAHSGHGFGEDDWQC